MIYILIVFAILMVVILIVRISRDKKHFDKVINKENYPQMNTNNSSAQFTVTDKNGNVITDMTGTKEEILNKLPEELREKVSKGDLKISGNVNKKTTTYKNGEIISQEETVSSNVIEKKAIKKCPNCGASIDLDLDKCIYCNTKIN